MFDTYCIPSGEPRDPGYYLQREELPEFVRAYLIAVCLLHQKCPDIEFFTAAEITQALEAVRVHPRYKHLSTKEPEE